MFYLLLSCLGNACPMPTLNRQYFSSYDRCYDVGKSYKNFDGPNVKWHFVCAKG